MQVGQKNQDLRPKAMLVEPFEARTELRTSATHRVEANALSGIVRLHLVNTASK